MNILRKDALDGRLLKAGERGHGETGERKESQTSLKEWKKREREAPVQGCVAGCMLLFCSAAVAG